MNDEASQKHFIFVAFHFEEFGKGRNWFMGPLLRIGKGKVPWADVDFEDGKAWCKLVESERGLRWVALRLRNPDP